MKAAKPKRRRVSVEEVGRNGPVLLERANGFGVYYVATTSAGAEIVRRVLLHTKFREAAERKFAAWKKANPGLLGVEASPAALPAVVDPDGEARREKARAAYHSKKNGGNGKVEIDREVLEAVMQSLSSSLQSVAASVRILHTILERH